MSYIDEIMPENSKNDAWVEIPRYETCFVCGKDNECGLNLSFAARGREIRTLWTPQERHCGYSGVVHGGVISAVLDEIMGWAGWLHYRKYYLTAELTVRFKKPVRAGEEYSVRAELTRTTRKIYQSEGWIEDDSGVLHASGSGKFVVRSGLERT